MDNNVNIGAVGDTPAMRQQIHDSAERKQAYGIAPGQLGNADPDTFWAAARVIVEQVYSLLVPGGVAIWVVKDFIRNGKRVPFVQQWAAMSKVCGFEWLHEHRAMLTEDRDRKSVV